MDVYCATCREPWDQHHMRHDEQHELGLPDFMFEGWDGTFKPSSEGDAQLRREFAKRGWEFGSSVLVILRCPCCPKQGDMSEEEKVAARERAELQALMGELLGDDLDGLACELEDMERYL
jgi:hypothetical protein